MLAFTEKVGSKFGGPEVPIFLLGHSLGGGISMIASCGEPSLYKGMTMVAPFFDLYKGQKEKFKKLKPLASLLNLVIPTWRIPFNADPPQFMKHWYDDPIDRG